MGRGHGTSWGQGTALTHPTDCPAPAPAGLSWQGEPQSLATIYQLVSQACEAAIQSEWPSLLERTPMLSLSPQGQARRKSPAQSQQTRPCPPFASPRTRESGRRGLCPAPR